MTKGIKIKTFDFFHCFDYFFKEHVQLYKNRPYFENSGRNWSKLGSLVGQLILLHKVYFIFGNIENKG